MFQNFPWRQQNCGKLAIPKQKYRSLGVANDVIRTLLLNYPKADTIMPEK